MYPHKQAFTLIEVLIVVLIIGILTAVAVPQYQKAVMKSKYLQMVIMGEVIARAQKRYYLEHGTYTANWQALDLDFGGRLIMTSYDDGSSNDIFFPAWGRCVLRTYSLGNVICDGDLRGIGKTHTGVPGFIYTFSTDKRVCEAVEGSSLSQRVCSSLTGDLSPNGNSYVFKN